MSYDTVKNGIATRLNALGYIESSQATDFKNAPAFEYSNRYILKCLFGEMGNETIIDRFDDLQTWQIILAFVKSENNDITQYDAAQRAKDALLKDIDKPANWLGIAKILKYSKWELTEEANYYILKVELSVLDTITY